MAPALATEKPQNTAPAASKARGLPDYFKPLINADHVSDAFRGRGGASEDYKLFVRALKDSSVPIESIRKSIDSATPSGKLYIAMILLARSPAEGKATLKSLSRDKTEIVVRTGCIANEYTVGSAAKELLTKGSLLSVYPARTN